MQQLQIKTPESYAFEKYGNVPVNLYTGMIDLKIPLFNIDIDGENSINMLLSYDSSGFIPRKKSDLAGVGWSLIGGGRITRSVNRMPDDYMGVPQSSGGNPFDTGANLHGFLTGVRLNSSTTNSQVYNLESGIGGISGLDWRLGNAANGYEGEPDSFNFSILGLSGKFMIGNDGKVIVESNDPNLTVDISGLKTYAPSYECKLSPSQIVIKDGQGNTYYFGGDFSKYEVSYPSNSANGPDHDETSRFYTVNAWSISQIIFQNGKTVTFNYVQDNLIDGFCTYAIANTLTNNSKIVSLDAFFQDGSRSGYTKNCPGGFAGCWTNYGSSPTSIESHILIKKSLLESVTFDSRSIFINYKDIGYPILQTESVTKPINEFVIDYISLRQNNIDIKKFLFNYSNLGGTYKRPFLTSLIDTKSNSKYSMEYYNTSNLPKYYTKGLDHWGFWNGNEGNSSLLAYDSYNSITGDYTLNGTIREPNTNLYNVALLSKITYPTNGYTTFEYESPSYGKRIERTSGSAFLPTLTNNTGYIGGARIKKQYDYSENGGLTNEKEYRYTTTLNGAASSGILMNWPRYIYFIEWKSNDGTFYQNLFLKSSSNVQQNSLDSYNIGYSKVFEIDKNKGYIEHNFYSYQDTPDILNPDTSNIKNYFDNPPSSGTYPVYPENLYKNFRNLFGIDKSIMRGKLKKDLFYKEGGTTPLKKEEYEYTDNIDFNPNNLKDNNNYVAINHLSGNWVQGYKKYFNSSNLKKQITTNYYGSDSLKVVKENFFTGTNHLNLNENQITDSNGNILRENISYLKDITSPTIFDQTMINKNMTSISLGRIQYKNNNKVTEEKTIYAPVDLSPEELNTRYLPKYIYSNFGNTLLDTSSSTDKNITIDSYGDFSNITQYTTRSGVPVTVIWGYNKTKPIAKIEGAKYSQVSSLDSTISIINASDTDATLAPRSDESVILAAFDVFRKDAMLADYQITTYTYDPLIGVRSITPPNGIRQNYIYDTANRLERILDAEKNIIKEFKYNYNTITFYNDERSKIFYRNNCGLDYIGGAFNYVVPANKYSSIINKEDANQQAQDDINENGQNITNNNANCTHICRLVPNNPNLVDASAVIQETSTNHFSATVNVTFLEEAHGLIIIGTINTCAPNSTKTFTKVLNGTTWTLKVLSSGDITISASSWINAGDSVGFVFEYDK